MELTQKFILEVSMAAEEKWKETGELELTREEARSLYEELAQIFDTYARPLAAGYEPQLAAVGDATDQMLTPEQALAAMQAGIQFDQPDPAERRAHTSSIGSGNP